MPRKRVKPPWERMSTKMIDRISGSYLNDPVNYARWYLNTTLTEKQVECLDKLHKPPYRVLCRSANSVGKTHLAACTASYWYDNFRPSIVITTAPTQTQVRDLLFKEIRTLRPLKHDLLPKATRVERRHDWYIHGFTTALPDAFQGRHAENLLIIFDEASGVRREFWERAETMFGGKPGHGWIAFYNPNDPSSPPALYENYNSWATVHISALTHPNIIAELAGLPAPIPSAIRLGRILDRLRDECDIVSTPDPITDFEFPIGSGVFYHPNTVEFEVQILGRWPTRPVNAIWSEAVWTKAITPKFTELQPHWTTQIGCDVARFGDDATSIHVRIGPVSVHHEVQRSWGTDKTAERLRELAHKYRHGKEAMDVPVLIDSCGVGGGVVDQNNGFNFIPVNSASRATQPDRYPNVRSELWFTAIEFARNGLMDLSHLDSTQLPRLRSDLMAPVYNLDPLNRRKVEEKERTKLRLGRSPDAADALNLAYYYR